jgi:hypothetical protein
MAINAAWHKKHPMPKNPTEEQRIKWHIAHAKNCGCRKITPSLAAQIKKMGFKVPPPYAG